MIVQTNLVGGSSRSDEHIVELAARQATLREILELLVRDQLAAYGRRREWNKTLRVLTPTDLVEGDRTGAYGREQRSTPKAPRFEDAHARAVEAFEDGLYVVFLDGRQVEELDVPLEVEADSTLRLVRLVALSGARR